MNQRDLTLLTDFYELTRKNCLPFCNKVIQAYIAERKGNF